MKLRNILKKGLFALALLLTLGFVAWQFENFRGCHAWRKYKKEAEARGEVMNPKQVIPPPIPESSNFAAIPFFTELFAFQKGAARESETDYFDPLRSYTKIGQATTNSLSHTWLSSLMDLRELAVEIREKRQPDRPFPEGELPSAQTDAIKQVTSSASTNDLTATEAATEVLEFLKQFEPVLSQMAEAAPRPQSRYPIKYETVPAFNTLLPHLRVLRGAANALKVRSAALLELGRTDEAAADVLLLLRLSESIKDEPVLISHLVRVALLQLAYQPLADGLARNAWSDSQLDQFQRALLAIDLRQGLDKTLEGEVVLFGLGTLDQVRQGLIKGDADVDSWPAVGHWMPDGWICLEMVNYHRAMRVFREAVLGEEGRITPSNYNEDPVSALLRSIQKASKVDLIFGHRLFSALLIPAVVRVAERTARAQDGTRAAALACALERYRLAKGKYPQSLAQIEPLIGGNLPGSIISGEPFQYKVAGTAGYVLYVPGFDGQDDGGNPFLERMIPEKQTGKDWVWTPFPSPERAGP